MQLMSHHTVCFTCFLLSLSLFTFSHATHDQTNKRRLDPESSAEEDGVLTEMDEMLQDDIHYHPGVAGHAELLYSDLSPTFLSAPEWADEDMYNEQNYEAYYSIRNSHNMRLTDEEIRQTLAEYQQALDDETEAEGGTSEEQEALKEAMTRKRAPSGVRAMCYSLGGPQILERCRKAGNWGNGVLIQMNDAQNDFLEFGTEWYESVKQLKKNEGLEVTGIFFGAPDWNLLRYLLEKYEGVFDKVQINVEGREGACITQLKSLADSGITKKGVPISYLAKGEDPDRCKTSQGFRSEWDLFVNHSDRDLKIPEGIAVEFPCYDGNEGRCFRAFTNYRETACDVRKQRYVFAPYDKASNRMLHLYNEACLGDGINLPAHDVVQAI
eukprot:GHVS01074952.1.p1 GENE.GHVS01074952.1~~GHVS01074952.1.p1  ORF type:complete len:382 (+),score=43.49 GHVS01074952.1:183-1328(+)